MTNRRTIRAGALCLLLCLGLWLMLAGGARAQTYTQNFDGVTPPALPASWSVTTGASALTSTAGGYTSSPNALAPSSGFAYYSGTSSANIDVTSAVNVVGAGYSGHFAVCLNAAGNTYYAIQVAGSSYTFYNVVKDNAGTTTTLPGGSSVARPAYTATAHGAWMMARLQVINGVVKTKMWNVGASEPSSWDFTYTDPSPLTAGYAGADEGLDDWSETIPGSLTAGTLSLNGSAAYNSVPLTFGAATGGTSPYTYDILRSLNGGMTSPTTLASGQSGLTYTDSTVAASTAYFYQVTAHDSASASAVSNILSVTTPSAPVAATSYTASLSASSGPVGSPVTITLTPNGTTTSTVTITESGAAGTLSSQPVTLNGTTPVTATFTPSGAGTATFSFANNGSLANPGSLTYTVNSTATFRADDSHLVYAGEWLDQGLSTDAANPPCREMWAVNGRIDFAFTGTGVTLHGNYPASTTVQYSVDGGSYATLANNSGAWGTITVTSGLTDTLHTLTLRATSAQTFRLALTDGIQVTGSAPALSVPSGFSPATAVAGASRYVTPLGLFSRSSANFFQFPQLMSFSAVAGSGIRFRATATALKVWCLKNGATVTVYADGVKQGGNVTLPTGGDYDWVTVLAATPDAANHEYTVAGTGSAAFQPLQVMPVGGTLGPAYGATGPFVAGLGDSRSDASAGITDFTQEYYSLLAGAKGYPGFLGYGLSGTYVTCTSQATGAQAGENRVWDVLSQWPFPSVVTVLYAVNDLRNLVPLSDFQRADTVMMTRLLSGLPTTTKVVRLGEPPITSLGSEPNQTQLNADIAAYNTVIQSDVTALQGAGYSNVVYSAPASWPTPFVPGTMTSDGLHPNSVGHATIESNIAPLVPAASTLSTTGTKRRLQ